MPRARKADDSDSLMKSKSKREIGLCHSGGSSPLFGDVWLPRRPPRRCHTLIFHAMCALWKLKALPVLAVGNGYSQQQTMAPNHEMEEQQEKRRKEQEEKKAEKEKAQTSKENESKNKDLRLLRRLKKRIRLRRDSVTLTRTQHTSDNTSTTSSKCVNNDSDHEIDTDMLLDDDDLPIIIGKKRGKTEDDACDGTGDFSSEMHKMLEGFGADISKTLSSKRKRLEQLTQGSLKSSNKKIEEVWRLQSQSRSKLQEEFAKQMYSVFQQWEADIDKTKDEEEKLNVLFKQQQKLFQQGRIVQGQRLKTLRQLSEQFGKNLDELETSQQSQQSTVQSELKKEMALLQKKILMDTQQQEMANVRKSLHSMLF